MIIYDEIKLKGFCSPKTMDKLVEILSTISDKPFRAVKYEIITIAENEYCTSEEIVVIKDEEFEKLEQYKRELLGAVKIIGDFSSLQRVKLETITRRIP